MRSNLHTLELQRGNSCATPSTLPHELPMSEPSSRIRDSLSQRSATALNDPPSLKVRSEKPITNAEALQNLGEFVEGASGVFAPRDATKSDLLKMQKAMKEEQELLAKL